jgi:hypothetical protein
MALDSDGGTGGGAGDGGAGGSTAGSAADLLGGAGGGGGAGAGAGGAAGGAGDGGGAGAGAAGGSGAGDAGAGGTGGDAGAGGADPDWWNGIPAEADGEGASLRDWVKSIGAKDVAALAKMARDNQKALRDSGRVKVPGEGASPEEVAAWHKAIGVPEDAKGYEIKAPVDADGNALPMNGPMIERLTAAAHKLGAPKAVLEGLVNELVAGELDERHQLDTQRQTEASAWAKEQGANLNVKIAAVDRAMAALGLSRDEGVAMRNVLGSEKTLNMLARFGEGMSEGSLLDAGGKTRFAVSAGDAKAELEQLKADPAWRDKAMVPGTPEYVRYNRLIDVIGEEANRRMGIA